MSKGRHHNKESKGKKRHTENYKKRILSILRKSPDKALNYKQIAARLGIKDPSGRNQIVKDLAYLAGKSKIDPVKRGKFKLAGNPDYFEGVLDMTTRGAGYVILDNTDIQDIYIPPKKLHHALDGDRVQVYCFGNPKKHKPDGEITTILSRKTTHFIGVLRLKDTFGFVEVQNPKMYTDIFVPRSKVNKGKDGEMVEVEIEKWPDKADSPEGKIIKVFGEPGAHETTMQTILAESGLASDFPKEVEDFANKLNTKITKKEIEKRRDLRDTLTFTIDPKDAKDFDDALSFRELENGHFEIGVHIADVSHYVRPGSVLDEEAFERGSSIYLVDRTIPMLPEVLSNKACSLRPQEEKYTFSAIFELNEQAEIKKQWFGKTIIKSDTRFAYEEAQHILDTQKGSIPKEIAIGGKPYKVPKKIVAALLTQNNLAKKLRTTRMQKGAITFDSTEVKFHLDENKNPTGVYFKTAQDANKLIEEFMLLANRKVSEYVSKMDPKRTFIYRCHDEPDEEKLFALKNLVHQFGYKLNLKSRQSTTQSLNNLLKSVNGKKEQNLVDTLTVRSMSKAYYSTKNIGHYGLAFEYYSHFTSPIRRYPDIMAHRLLQRYLEKKSSVNAEEYEKKCLHCSETERYATNAERDSVKYMQVKFMQQHKGKNFKGVISGVTDFGIFVEIIENKCEGLIRLRDLPGDHYDYVEEEFAVIGRHAHKRYRLGDEITVKVKATDLVKRNLDFELITAPQK